MATAANVKDTDLVFPHSCHSRTILAIWKRLQTFAGVEEQYRFHDLRVSFCTNLVASGVEAPQLKQLARHRSIETTMKYYRGRTVEADRKALDRMEAAFLEDNVAEKMSHPVENKLVNAFSTSKIEPT